MVARPAAERDRRHEESRMKDGIAVSSRPAGRGTGASPGEAVEVAHVRVAVIGAGMSGILMGIRLMEAGIHDFVIFEKAANLGGTWRENTYPGIACDVASHHYCYSFEPNPDWSHRFPPGAEIQAYFEGVAAKYGILGHIRFGTEIARLAWEGSSWRVECKGGRTLTADLVVSAAGVLHHPAYPDIEGLESFRGEMFHTARWRHDVDLRGKRVGIIGTGSTAAQVVPSIVDQVARLEVFQRSRHWVHPLPDKEYSGFGKAFLRRFPFVMKLLYQWYYWLLERNFSDVVVGKRSAKSLEKRCRALLATVRDPELRAKLTPDYPPGCKRLIFSSTYYAALQRPNAELVTDPIARIEPEGIRTRDGRLHELDVLVLSTGFRADRFLRPIEVTGENGVSLEQLWEEGPRAYRSIAVAGLPNFFMLIGPHSPIGNLSLIAISEWQADYILKCVAKIFGEGVQLSPTPEATQRLADEMKQAAKRTVWVSGCSSWYLAKDGTPALYPWEPSRFYAEMKVPPDWKDFDVRPLAAAARES
jgi:cation diffusion facilitator CzcD-associated flavoprotein CzcO